jgi:hypothetical protein
LMPSEGMAHYDLHSYRAPVFRATLSILEKKTFSGTELSNLIEQHGRERFVSFLAQNSLASIFYAHLTDNPDQLREEQAIKEALRLQSLADAAKYLSQKSTLIKTHKVFEAANINYAVFKGAHVRESAYEHAWLRTTADIDVLVTKEDREGAIEALKHSGMQYHPNLEVLSHEATLTNHDTSVDLHWHIMRPGRTRIDMTENLLEGAELCPDYKGMSPTATLFVLLTHPAINKYVCSPDASLIKIIDLCLWLKREDIDYNQLYVLINTAGLKTAAWSTLLLICLMTGEPQQKNLLKKLQPNYLQRKYIQFWVSKDLPTRFYNHRWLMRTAFSLSLHDNVADMIRAVSQLVGYRVKSKDI